MNESEILEAALRLPEKERAAFLNGVFHDQPEARAQMEARIADCLTAESAAEPGDTTTSSSALPDVDATIGSYKLLQRIGEGGFGVVYMASQLRPVKRKVALKVIKPGMDSRLVVARFEAERQALAMMEHPHIAKVLDGGTTCEGRPYFVMELVKGVPITAYCDDNKLSIESRLKLFVNVCEAVQHAHQKGVIHRDIKPSNVMVTLHDGKPVVKVIDFGVAKAMHSELTEKTLFTAYGQMIGTPQYMSPEQAEMSGLDVDTRSDIYSLGVLLYELLTGTTPLESEELKSAGLVAMQKLIKDKTPPRPSLRLSSVGEKLTHLANLRSIDPRDLPREIRGDLDWIVMKSLSKERERRYETATGFANDVERFLNNEIVKARPPSTAYILQKLASRHKYAVGSAVGIALALFIGLIFATCGIFQADRATKRAIEAEQTAKTESERRARNLYFADMSLAYQLWDENNYTETNDILSKYANFNAGKHRGFEWRYLWKALESRREAIEIPFRDVPHAVRFSDNNTVCIASWSGEITRHDLRDRIRDPLPLLQASFGRNVTDSTGSAAGWILGSGRSTTAHVGFWRPDQRSVVLRSLTTRKETLIPNTEMPTRFAFAHDEKHVLVFRSVGETQLIDIETGDVTASLAAKGGLPVNDLTDELVAISPDGIWVAVIVDDEVQMWQIDSKMPKWSVTLPGHPKVLEFSPNSTQLAVGAENGAVRLFVFDVTSGTKAAERSDHSDAVRGLAYSPDGTILVSGSRDNSIRLWDANNLARFATLKGHSGIVNDVAFSPDGTRIASVSQDYTAVIWDLPDVRDYAPSSIEHRSRAEIVEDSAVVLVDKGLRIIDLKPGVGSKLDTFDGRKADAFAVNKLGTIAIAYQGTVEIHRSGHAVITASVSDGDKVTALCLGNKEPLVAIGTQDGLVGILNLDTNRFRKGRKEHPEFVRALAFDPDDRVLASGGGVWGHDGDADIIVWNATQLESKPIARLAAHLDQVTSLAFSLDGDRLVSGSIDNSICIWNWKDSETPERKLAGHTASVRRVMFSPDGRRIVSCAGDRTVRFWDWETGVQCGQIQVPGDLKGISSIDWLDEESLFGMDHYGGIHIWEGPRD